VYQKPEINLFVHHEAGEFAALHAHIPNIASANGAGRI